MRYIFIVFLSVFHQIFTIEPLQVPKIYFNYDANCNRIKCPTTLAPVCSHVTLKEYDMRRLGSDIDRRDHVPVSRDVYITMANKCEFERMKCFEDNVKIEVVSMKFCDQHNQDDGGNVKRSKRDLVSDTQRYEVVNRPRYYYYSAKGPKTMKRAIQNKRKDQSGSGQKLSSAKTDRVIPKQYKMYVKHPERDRHVVYRGVHKKEIFHKKHLQASGQKNKRRPKKLKSIKFDKSVDELERKLSSAKNGKLMPKQDESKKEKQNIRLKKMFKGKTHNLALLSKNYGERSSKVGASSGEESGGNKGKQPEIVTINPNSSDERLKELSEEDQQSEGGKSERENQIPTPEHNDSTNESVGTNEGSKVSDADEGLKELSEVDQQSEGGKSEQDNKIPTPEHNDSTNESVGTNEGSKVSDADEGSKELSDVDQQSEGGKSEQDNKIPTPEHNDSTNESVGTNEGSKVSDAGKQPEIVTLYPNSFEEVFKELSEEDQQSEGGKSEQDNQISTPEQHDSRNESVVTNVGSKVSNNDTGAVDMDEYHAKCPKFCPTRDVMVCARCQHGVYRTFNSVCHMRLFSCRYSDENLELISRTPCAMSSPFLTGDDMAPHGRLSEPNDKDYILKYIFCRDNDGVNEDPRCQEIRRRQSMSMALKGNAGR